jgi:hypothetical protein
MKTTTYSLLTAVILATLSSASTAEPYRPLYALSKEYSITAFAKYVKNAKGNKQVKYEFVLDNRSDNHISEFTLGHESIKEYDLGVAVIPLAERENMPFTAPSNWVGAYRETAQYDEAADNEILLLFYWGVNDSLNDTYTKYVIPARTKQSGFGFTTNKKLPRLATSFAQLSTSRDKWVNGKFEYEMIQLTKGDTIAPTASLAATLVKHPTKTGFYNVNLKVTAKDNYDPLPEIVFTSVQDMSTATKNTSPFNAGAYTLNTPNNVTTGAYPSIITFTADANTAKQYKINYTVTDASDNKTDVSTTVTVPKR